jgi:hypothetical protein
MKHLTIKRIVSLLIIICIGVVLGIYFFGGLNPDTVELDNIPFNESDFKSFNTLDENGTKVDLTFNKNVVVGENTKYIMIFNEETTIVKIYDKTTSTPIDGDYSNCQPVYQSAQDDLSSSRGANLTVRYAQKSNGKIMATGLDSMLYSVQFENTLTGVKERHYKINYLENGDKNDGVQVLYEIGRFSANQDYFPVAFNVANYKTAETAEKQAEIDQFNASTMEEIFRGNVTFNYDLVQDSVNKTLVLTPTYTGYAYTKAGADYIEANGLATVTEAGEWWLLKDVSPELLNGYGVHLNTENSPLTNNPFFSKQEFMKFQTYYPIQKPNDFADRQHYARKADSSTQQSSLYEYLYIAHQQKDVGSNTIPVVDEEGNPVMRGGFHARDEQGNFLYEDGKPVQELYSLEQVAKDNALFGAESITSLQRFQVAIQFKLTDKGLEATILADSLRDASHAKLDAKYDHNYIMNEIQLLPELTTVNESFKVDDGDGDSTNDVTVENEGMMIIPDGSGAIINFNNNKAVLNYAPYSKNIYGADRSFVQQKAPEQVEKLMFGMFGLINLTNKTGIMAVVEKGAAQTSLYADTPRGANHFNTIYYTSTVRQNESVTAGTGWNTSNFMKWSPKLLPSDLKYHFVFLEESELSYVGLANKYREYLMDRYNLKENDTTETNLVDINFLGAFERYSMVLGIKYMTSDSLTTFDQAQAIIKELISNNVSTLSVGYQSWTNKEFEYETTSSLKVSSVLGKAKSMIALNDYLVSQGINFYPEIFVSSSKGYDYNFGTMKYTAKGVGNAYAKQYPFNLATLIEDKSANPTYYLNPAFYKSISQNLLKSYNKLGISGAYLSDLGNTRIGHYAKGDEVYPYIGTLYQEKTLKLFQDEVKKLKVSAPFDYAFPYVTTAIDVPLKSSLYGIFDATIPFYQLVVSGLFDYTTDAVNGISDKSREWYVSKALETGSNLQFTLSAEDPKVLLETDYTQYFKSYYNNWKDEIIEMNNKINDSGIHGGRLIDHEVVDKDIAKVTYSNEVVLLVNTGNKDYYYENNKIPAYGYYKLGGE